MNKLILIISIFVSFNAVALNSDAPGIPDAHQLKIMYKSSTIISCFPFTGENGIYDRCMIGAEESLIDSVIDYKTFTLGQLRIIRDMSAIGSNRAKIAQYILTVIVNN